MRDSKYEIISNEYYILDKLDNGGTSNVYLLKSFKNEKNYVAKIYNSNSKLYYEKEVEILKKISLLNAPNIIRLISYGEEEIKIDSYSEPENKQYIILDYFPNKDLLSFIMNKDGIDEQTAINFFKEILKAVQICHNNNICHRDLKLDNILLDEFFQPVLCDFGFSTLIEADDQTKLTDYVSTIKYASPEILRRNPYDGKKSDIFSLGVILFTLLFSKFGFEIATPSNNLYKLIIKKNYEKYWKEIGKNLENKKVESISPQLKELYIKMISYNPNERPSIETVIECINNI